MNEIASDRSSLVVLPLPIDLFEPFIETRKRAAARNGGAPGAAPADDGVPRTEVGDVPFPEPGAAPVP
jgi:hypothetical protein